MAGPLNVARQRKPPRRVYRQWRQPAFTRPLSVASERGLAAAIATINGAGEPLAGDAALARMEQHRVDAEAQRRRQGCLPLGSGPE